MQKQSVLKYAASVPEATMKTEFGVDRWVHDLNGRTRYSRLYSQPTINIEGLVGGYTGPGGKTVLPHKAVAKIDMRLVPDMTAPTRWRNSKRIWQNTASATSKSI